MYTYEATRTEDGRETVTVFTLGRAMTADDSHPNFAAIKVALLKSDAVDEQSLAGLFDIPFGVGQVLMPLTRTVSASNGRLYFNGKEMHGALADAAVLAVSDGATDVAEGLANFFEKFAANEDQESVDGTYAFLGNADLQIDPAGDVIAYKKVYWSEREGFAYRSSTEGKAIVDGVVQEGYIHFNVGSVVEMPRDEVLNDPTQACGPGLHVASYHYGFSGDVHLQVAVHPADIVSVPRHDTKMRVCRFVVLGEVEERDSALLVRTTSADDHLTEATAVTEDAVVAAFIDDPAMLASDDGKTLGDDDQLRFTVTVDPTNIGRDVAGLRKQRGLSQRKLAKKTGVSKSYIGQIEKGERTPSAEWLARLLEALS